MRLCIALQKVVPTACLITYRLHTAVWMTASSFRRDGDGDGDGDHDHDRYGDGNATVG